MPKKLAMVQVDVFSPNRFEGNPLAVFLDGRNLSDSQMQAIAREMNLSETTFILPRDPATEKEQGIRVRIFTVAEELPFAGHPTLGTASVVRGSTGVPQVTLDLKAGRVPVRFEDSPGKPSFGEMTQLDPTFGSLHDREAVARACGLRADDIDSSLPIQTVSTGLRQVIVPLRSLEVMRGLSLDQKRVNEYMQGTDGTFFYFVSRETVDRSARLHARMLFYNGEDPATGSAGGCAAAWMVAYGVAQPDERVLIEQGLEMKRPSQIFVRASRHDNRVINVRVGGSVAEVMRGELFLAD
jgi:trans-2,3-dihydro-3-hydroxyanthranilate isomerase